MEPSQIPDNKPVLSEAVDEEQPETEVTNNPTTEESGEKGKQEDTSSDVPSKRGPLMTIDVSSMQKPREDKKDKEWWYLQQKHAYTTHSIDAQVCG